MARFGDGWYQGKTFYGAFIEFGHKIRKGKIKVAGKHFMLDATKSVRSIAERVAIERMIYELEKTAPKNG